MSREAISDRREELLAASAAVAARAHAPYSNFHVGAALLADDGQVYVGCNVENAAYPIGTCAEAGAIAALIAGGARRIRAVAVVGPGERICTPCGGCRQRLAEFADAGVPVWVGGADGQLRATYTVGELLPAGFDL